LVDDALKARAEEYHEKLVVELAVEQDEEVLMQYLEGREMPDIATLEPPLRTRECNPCSMLSLTTCLCHWK
jgi:hypothetical protein